MSSVTLSPSPILFRHPSSSSLADASQYNVAPPNNDFFFERRRTSHPHNAPIHSFQAAAEDMSQRSGSQLRPRLEHQASRTLIDLTEDAEDGDDVPLVRHHISQRPPHLGRSDAQRLADIIDLTEDDAEIQITGARNRELPLPRPDVARPPPHLHVPRRDSPQILFGRLGTPNQPPNPNRVFPEAGGFGVMLGAGGVHVRIHDQGDIAHFIQRVQAMPGQMDYRHPAFADRKPDHVPPEPAKSGFTRSPKEDDTIICPSCEQELVHNNDLDEPVLKKSGKAPTKKEREEHPFWVVKDCGHVSTSLPSLLPLLTRR